MIISYTDGTYIDYYKILAFVTQKRWSDGTKYVEGIDVRKYNPDATICTELVVYDTSNEVTIRVLYDNPKQVREEMENIARMLEIEKATGKVQIYDLKDRR